MGGEHSSYYAILAMVGFLCAVWCASRISRLIGISSIVLEIGVGLALSPQILQVMPKQYAECYDATITDCDSEYDQGRIANKGPDYCDVEAYREAHTCDMPEYCDRRLGTSPGRTLSVPETVPEAEHVAAMRRLGGGGTGEAAYDSYSECLKRMCDLELKQHCSMNPDMFTLIGHTGVAMMIFESGMHFDFEKARVVGPWACAVAVLGTTLPLISGCLLIMAYGFPFFPDGVAAGTALAPTSVGIALRLLHEAKQLQSNFGQAIITAAFVDDILSLILFNVLFSLGAAEVSFMGTFFKPLMGVTFMVLACLLAVDRIPTALKSGLARFEGREEFPTQDQALFLIMIVVLIAYAQITHLCGTHLWGCFIAGMSFAMLPQAHHVWVQQTKRYTSWMIRIFFSATVAFAIPIDELGNPDNIWKGAIMGIGPCILSKVLCAPFMGETRFVVGWAMVGRAEFAYLIAQMAQAANMMEPATFSIVIWSLLWATVWAPFIFRVVLSRYSRALAVREAAETGRELEEAPRPKFRTSDSTVMDLYADQCDPDKVEIRRLTELLERSQLDAAELKNQLNVQTELLEQSQFDAAELKKQVSVHEAAKEKVPSFEKPEGGCKPSAWSARLPDSAEGRACNRD